jgi:aminoglycoside 3-N-acetyltransferase
MISFRELAISLKKLDIPNHQPVLAHISNTVIPQIKGGSDTLLAALLATVDNVIMPTFTYQTMVIPLAGPTNNALEYGLESTEMSAEVFNEDLPSSVQMGETAEKLRKLPQARRSIHPILSFSGLGLDEALNVQTLSDPWAPIQKIGDRDGWVLLVGCDQTVNCTLHFAEMVVGRKQFIRWALTEDKVVECPHYPGCSRGFNSFDSLLEDSPRQTAIGSMISRAYSMKKVINDAVKLFQKDPLSLLCSQPDCNYCSEIRRWTVSRSHWIPLR